MHYLHVQRKWGAEWLAEVYGDLWLLPGTLIASCSAGRPGRPVESSDQHRGFCRWAHQKNTVYPGLLWRQMVSRSTPKPDDKQRQRRRERRAGRDGQLAVEWTQDFNLASEGEKLRWSRFYWGWINIWHCLRLRQ